MVADNPKCPPPPCPAWFRKAVTKKPDPLYVVGLTMNAKTQLFAEVGERQVCGIKIDMGERKYATAMPRAIAQALASVMCSARPDEAGKFFIEEAQ